MVFLVTSKNGLAEALRLSNGGQAILWLAHGLLTESELQSLRGEGHDVTVWSYPESTSFNELQGSVETIEEHHPGHTVWVECASNKSPVPTPGRTHHVS